MAINDRPNASQFRPSTPSRQRTIKKASTPPVVVNGTDRFAIHVAGNTQITVGGTYTTVLSGTDPDYNLNALSPYYLAQQGIAFTPTTRDNLNISGDSTLVGSTMTLADWYDNEPSEVPGNEAIFGIGLEFYYIGSTGNKTVEISGGLQQGDQIAPVGQAPLGVSAYQNLLDSSAQMAQTPTYLTLPTVSTGIASCPMKSMALPKYSWVAYLPKILKESYIDMNTENRVHTLGIVLSFNGGAPKLFKVNMRSTIDQQGATGSGYFNTDEVAADLTDDINSHFKLDYLNYLNAQTALKAKLGLTSIAYSDQVSGGVDLTTVSGEHPLPGEINLPVNLFGNEYNSGGSVGLEFQTYTEQYGSGSMQFLSIFLGGDSLDRYMAGPGGSFDPENLNCHALSTPCYVTVHPNHALLKADPYVTIDLGLESLLNQNSAVNDFNIHSAAARFLGRLVNTEPAQ